MRSKLKTECSATEWWPMEKIIFSLERLALATSAQACRLSSLTSSGLRLIRA